ILTAPLLTCVLIAGSAFAQLQYSLKIESGQVATKENVSEYVAESEQQLFNDRYYKIVQFYSTPEQSQKEEMENAGIRFFEYLPDYVYFVSFPVDFDKQKLSTFNVRGVYEITSDMKISEVLKNGIPSEDYTPEGKINIIVSCYSDVGLIHAEARLFNDGY